MGFPACWENDPYITSSSVTVVRVFALKHTPARQQEVTQRKLGGSLRAQPTADSRLIALEGASDDELEALTDLSQAHAERALGTDAPPPIMGVSPGKIGINPVPLVSKYPVPMTTSRQFGPTRALQAGPTSKPAWPLIGACP